MGLEGLVKAWADENEHSSLNINLFDPGATATEMRFNAMPGEDQSTPSQPGGRRRQAGRLSGAWLHAQQCADRL